MSAGDGGTVVARCAAPNGEPNVTIRFRSLDAISVDGLTITSNPVLAGMHPQNRMHAARIPACGGAHP